MTALPRSPEDLAATIRRDGFVFLPGQEARAVFGLPDASAAWTDFATSWDDLRPDRHMADGGRYRLRRHAAYSGGFGAAVVRAPHRPHYQAVQHNPLNGGIERWFEPVSPEMGTGPAMTALLEGVRQVFEMVAPPPSAMAGWLAEAHQFRTVAKAGTAGKPTPEGMHRDGVAFVLVTLVGRENIAGGRTTIRIDGREQDASFTLKDPMDTVLLDDTRVWHGVTPVEPVDPALPAHRDVLVLTFAGAPPREG
jgi:hypothetical protein